MFLYYREQGCVWKKIKNVQDVRLFRTMTLNFDDKMTPTFVIMPSSAFCLVMGLSGLESFHHSNSWTLLGAVRKAPK
jgi:hypothetical protein